jgi:hypothetical protein
MNEKQIKITLYSLVLFFDVLITIGIPIGVLAETYFSKLDHYIIIVPIFGIVSFFSLIGIFALNHKRDFELLYFEKFLLHFITAINLSLYTLSFVCLYLFISNDFKL